MRKSEHMKFEHMDELHKFGKAIAEPFLKIKPTKTVTIMISREHADMQAEDVRRIMEMATEIKTADNRDDVLIQTAIAVGYANAMRLHGLINEEELHDLIDMLGTVGEDRLKEVSKLHNRLIFRHIRKAVRK